MNTIADIAVADDRFNLLVGSIQLVDGALPDSDLLGAISDPNASLTVFAPTDDAFIGLAQTLGFDGEAEDDALAYLGRALNLLSDGNAASLLSTILTYHIANGALFATDVIDIGTVTTLQGGSFTLNPESLTLIDADPDIADPGLVLTDIPADNGVIHVLNGVLLPADLLVSNGDDDVDFILAGDDRDYIRTGRDNDFVDAGGGRDFVSLGSGNDIGFGGDGNDRMYGGRGEDIVRGNDGRDAVYGGRGNDVVSGDGGNDRVYGNSGDDMVFGSEGRDYVSGGSGDDMVSGGAGNDFVCGGSGDDVISGGTGNDYISGGWGADTIIFAEGDGHDRVAWFSTRHDKIDLSDFGFDSFDDLEDQIQSHWWFNTEIDLGEGDSIYLFGVRAHHLDEDNFIL